MKLSTPNNGAMQNICIASSPMHLKEPLWDFWDLSLTSWIKNSPMLFFSELTLEAHLTLLPPKELFLRICRSNYQLSEECLLSRVTHLSVFSHEKEGNSVQRLTFKEDDEQFFGIRRGMVWPSCAPCCGVLRELVDLYTCQCDSGPLSDSIPAPY